MPCGLIIEKVNGIPCEKRLTKDETFADVRYLLEMCKQVGSSFCLCFHEHSAGSCTAQQAWLDSDPTSTSGLLLVC